VYQAPRGTEDVLPPDESYWRYVTEKAFQTARLYGYDRIETPTFEDAGLSDGASGKVQTSSKKRCTSLKTWAGTKSL